MLSFWTDSKTTTGIAAAMEQLEAQYGDRFPQVFRSITTNNGNEFAIFSAFKALGTDIYFIPHRNDQLMKEPTGCSGDSSPKDVLFNTDGQIFMFTDEIDAFPRKHLGYHTPEELFEEQLDRIYASKRAIALF